MRKRRITAEFDPTQAVILTWPHDMEQWGEQLPPAQHCIAQVAAWCSSQCDVIICAHNESIQSLAKKQLEASCDTISTANFLRIQTYLVPNNNIWVRDHGPIAITFEEKVLLMNFDFNGWGQKYPHAWDNAITDTLALQGVFGDNIPHNVPFVLEGGSIDSDGRGNLLTTSRCLLSETRNGSAEQPMTKEQAEEALTAWLGPHTFIWLDVGDIVGDDTDGHIDTIVRFLRPAVVAFQDCDDPNDANYAAAKALEEELWKKMWFGRRIPLPMPAPIFNDSGEQLPATYVNFLICNDLVLVPSYDDPNDQVARDRIQEELPNHQIIGIDCRAIIHEFGSLHCATMQLPEGSIYKEVL